MPASDFEPQIPTPDDALPDAAAVIEVVPGRLLWAARAPSGHLGHRFNLQSIPDADFKAGQYEVCHYSKGALGAAFGPLSWGQTLRFCQALDAQLRSDELVFVEHGVKEAEHLNMAVLLGAYLLLCKNWSAQQVIHTFPREASAGFICSWAKHRFSERTMAVQDCWHGLELAMKLSWIQGVSLDQDHLVTSLAISKYQRVLTEYDGVWLIPGRVFVMADPMTTIRDTNPATCSSLLPFDSADSDVEIDLDDIETPHAPPSGHVLLGLGQDDDGKIAPPLLVSGSMPNLGSKAAEDDPPKDMENTSTTTLSKGTSLHSVCKEYQGKADAAAASCPKVADIITFYKKSNITFVARMNSSEEEGLVETGGSYDPSALKRFGIQHVDHFVKDTGGGLPTRGMISRFLKQSRNIGLEPAMRTGFSNRLDKDDSSALAVHCKSGFGRSVVLAACLMIHRYDVPGRSLLGWVRIVRPGAITVPQQEEFLCSFTGRRDLWDFLGWRSGMPVSHPLCDPARKCCTVQ